jgi:hypothetical protein
MPNRVLEFQKTITRELTLIKDRVEFLIGDANWGEVGSFKESILRKVISQFLPSNLKIGTGFIVGNTDHYSGREEQISSQMDIIVYEGKSPVVFREGDFVIITENAVRAVVEVKAKTINYSDPASRGHDEALNKIISKLNRLRVFETFTPIGDHKKKFIGVFSYQHDSNFSADNVDDALRESNGLVNHVSLGPDKFIRYWEDTLGLDPPAERNGRCYIRYTLRDLSFSYFISNLLHYVADEDPVDRYWFSFPIEGTKERYRARSNPFIWLNH